MTRINLVPPEELTDQHLFAEFREIKMIPKSLDRSLNAACNRGENIFAFKQSIPLEFTLNTGHVKFFFNKGAYLRKRYELIKDELRVRGINFNESSLFDPDGVFHKLSGDFNNDYTPTPEAYIIIRSRIKEKIDLKPNWYRYKGNPLS